MPATSPANFDLTEALTSRYSDAVIKVLPLSSGAWAIYGAGAGPPVILAFLDEEKLLDISASAAAYGKKQKSRFTEPNDRQFAAHLRFVRKVETKPDPIAAAAIDVDDL